MKTIYIVIVILATMGLVSAHAGQPAVADKDLGLSKTTVFDTPSPAAFAYSESSPGSGKTLPRAYAGAPPQIPHNIQGFMPVTARNNMCVGCHNNPAMWGKKAKGAPTPMPPSHYTDTRNAPDNVTKKMIGARFVCTQCHVPQANVQPLVDNTF
jgi:cytochrome c-type protein NapB